MITELVIVVVAIVLGIVRAYGVKHIAFQAVAHLFVGGLVGAWLINYKRTYLFLAVALTVIEVVCFLMMRHGS